MEVVGGNDQIHRNQFQMLRNVSLSEPCAPVTLTLTLCPRRSCVYPCESGGTERSLTSGVFHKTLTQQIEVKGHENSNLTCLSNGSVPNGSRYSALHLTRALWVVHYIGNRVPFGTQAHVSFLSGFLLKIYIRPKWSLCTCCAKGS